VKPILDVPTRWNSTADMVDRALRLRRPLTILFDDMNQAAGDDNSYKVAPAHWKIFDEYSNFLSLFKQATEMACADQYPSLSLVVPLFNSLLDHSEKTINLPNISNNLKMAATACKEKLSVYYDISREACSIATVLDPRLRLEYYKAGDGSSNHVSSDFIFDSVDSKYLAYYAPASSSTQGTAVQESSSSSSQISSLIFKKRRIDTTSEFKEYCRQPCSDADVMPLQWWKENEQTFPNLAKMAKDYLAIPGTSASSERAFSGGSQLITAFRCSLSPSTVSACMLLKSWL
jgi:hypothetical protein